VILGLLCGCTGSLYIQFQKKVNQWKKRMVGKYPRLFGNNFVYTLTVCFILSSVIYSTRIMQSGDKKVIGAMINIDQTLSRLGYTEDNIDKKLSENFKFSYDILNGKWRRIKASNPNIFLFLFQTTTRGSSTRASWPSSSCRSSSRLHSLSVASCQVVSSLQPLPLERYWDSSTFQY